MTAFFFFLKKPLHAVLFRGRKKSRFLVFVSVYVISGELKLNFSSLLKYSRRHDLPEMKLLRMCMKLLRMLKK